MAGSAQVGHIRGARRKHSSSTTKIGQSNLLAIKHEKAGAVRRQSHFNLLEQIVQYERKANEYDSLGSTLCFWYAL